MKLSVIIPVWNDAPALIACLDRLAPAREEIEVVVADADTAVRGMHNTLLNMVTSGLIRQLPNGDFAPATIQLRRAM